MIGHRARARAKGTGTITIYTNLKMGSSYVVYTYIRILLTSAIRRQLM